MSDPLASYAFLPWLQRGMSTQIGRIDFAGPATPRESVDVALTFNDPADGLAAQITLNLAGPGEVGGLDPRAVLRAYPKPEVHDAEPNYFPFLELDQPDLPWRYTPARPTAEQRLRPWCCLVALKADEITDYQPAGEDGALAAVTVASAASLPDVSQSWAWAHVQVSGVRSVDAATAADLLAHEPARLLSRVMCPRRLDQKTAYRVFLVPTFKRGAMAGLRADFPDPDNIDGLAAAWAGGDANVRLPIYFEWRFTTGVAEDFEFLARLLQARRVPKTVGIRDMDVSGPSAGLPPASTSPLGLEGALMAPETESTVWDETEKATFGGALAVLLNLPADRSQAIVVPPLYGTWHAGSDHLVFPTGQPPWFHELSADPRLRVTGGLGTQVVQSQQRQLMASAWQQVGPIREYNDRLRREQLARELAARIHERHLAVPDAESVLLVTAPVHWKVMGSPLTVQALLRRSPIAAGTFEPQWRRVSRPLGPIGRRQGRPALPRTSRLLQRMNRGELSPAPLPPTPAGMFTPSRAGATLVPAWASPDVITLLAKFPRWLLIVAVLALLAAAVLVTLSAPGIAALLAGIGAAALVAAAVVRRIARDVTARAAVRDGTLTAAQVRAVPPRPAFVATELPPGGGPPPPVPPPSGTPGRDSPSARDFRVAAADMLIELQTQPAPGPELHPVSLPGLRDTVVAATDPEVTFAASVKQRLKLAPRAAAAWQPDDPVQPVMAAPDFPQPMYEPLRDLSQDWLLPGLDQVPPNTETLLETNQRFVEAYMVGLCHEMARELLWNEYPTDRRGTYFRQFWDVRGYVPPPGETVDPERLKDIKPIHTWKRAAALGENTSRRPPPGGKHLVLLVRGELLRRYPNTLVYAVKAQFVAGKRTLDDSQQLHPVFRGTLKPDVTFFGFELTESEARGSRPGSGDEGWFFVLQEHPDEPRFGLDLADGPVTTPAATWNDLSWGHLIGAGEALTTVTYIDLTKSPPDTAAAEAADHEHAVWHANQDGRPRGSRASDLARITLQLPLRIAIHGSQMLPSEGPS